MRRVIIIICALLMTLTTMAQSSSRKKMSPMVRLAAIGRSHTPRMMLLARITGDRKMVVERYGGKLHAQLGGVSVVELPVAQLAAFSEEEDVRRMEASGRSTALLDTTGVVVDAMPVYSATNLPQAYTGKGVVMGVMDIGFDLTHPTFYDNTASTYRVKALWDQLDNDGFNDNDLPIGKQYIGEEALLRLGHSYDGIEQAHGTHTTGIAAGSGYDTSYRGLAWESDICLVANATTNNANLIPDSLLEMYNSTMDILGFKYIFDYAESVGKPCVISFSEGSTEDLVGEDKLIYEALEALTGPGRILVASAGNTGTTKHYFHKPIGTANMGAFVSRGSTTASFTLNTTAPVDVRMVVYSQHPDTIVYRLDDTEREVCDTLLLEDGEYIFTVEGNPSPYYDGESSYVVGVKSPGNVGTTTPLSVELLGSDADAEFFATGITLTTNNRNPALSAGDCSRGIHSPGSAPCVICVGANGYRGKVKNYKDVWYSYDGGTDGLIAPYSSLGPTFDRRTKPDVVAPGTVVSAFNSYNLEAYPNSWCAERCTTHSEWNGRRYGWCVNIGTSMSTPVVGGAVALWLEANPNLMPADIFDIISTTSIQPDPSLTYPNNTYGYGEIDVYAGLVEALKRTTTGLESLSMCQPKSVTYNITEGRLNLHFLSTATRPIVVNIFSATGTLMRKVVVPSGVATYAVDLSSMSRGIYAVQIDGEGSLLIRN